MDKEKRAALRTFAEEATPGPWAFGSFHRLLVVPIQDGFANKHNPIADIGETAYPWHKTVDSKARYIDASYIAAANPSTILQLLDYIDTLEKDAACKQVGAEPFVWHEGYPPFPQDQEWFIAVTKYGDRVVLRALPEDYLYDYKTADETYMKKENVVQWAQFPDCEYLPPQCKEDMK